MFRPSKTPLLTKSSEQISRQRGQLWSQSSQWRKSQCNGLRKMTTGSSRSPKLPLTLHFLSNVTKWARVKLNKVFFPRWLCQARSLGFGFAGWWMGTVGISSDDEATGCPARFAVTAAVHPRLVESHHIGLQSTGQKAHCVITL